MNLYIIALLATIAVLKGHLLGLDGLYAQHVGYDILMHVLGGVAMALIALALSNSKPRLFFSRPRNVLIFVLFAGIVWELFEMYFAIAGAPLWTKAYYIDTVKDLVDDLIGGMVVSLIYFKFIKK